MAVLGRLLTALASALFSPGSSRRPPFVPRCLAAPATADDDDDEADKPVAAVEEEGGRAAPSPQPFVPLPSAAAVDGRSEYAPCC